MTQKSDADRMKEALAVINDAAESQPHKEYALDLILFCIEDIDNACDFVKFDGAVATLLQLLEADVPTFRLAATARSKCGARRCSRSRGWCATRRPGRRRFWR